MDLPEPIRIEPLTKETVQSLIRLLGPGVMTMKELNQIDVKFGRGVLPTGAHDRCVWTKSGYRITVNISPYAISSSQTREPDPYYLERRKSPAS